MRVATSAGELRVDALVACAGLYADRVAAASGFEPEARIVPFRGEYFELSPDKHYLVRGLIYPVPDPRFPFLGVHLTRMVGGGVHAGPNAVLALRREGYTWRDVDLAELRDSLAWPGLWQLAKRNVVPGAREVIRSLSRRQFAASLSRLVPGIAADDLHPAPAGVRAQALRRDGSMVEDFLVQTHGRQIHVLNAPSPLPLLPWRSPTMSARTSLAPCRSAHKACRAGSRATDLLTPGSLSLLRGRPWWCRRDLARRAVTAAEGPHRRIRPRTSTRPTSHR